MSAWKLCVWTLATVIVSPNNGFFQEFLPPEKQVMLIQAILCRDTNTISEQNSSYTKIRVIR